MVAAHFSLVMLALCLDVKWISGQCNDGPLYLFGFWELSGRQNLNDSDLSSCNVTTDVTFPSSVGSNEAQVIGQVTYVTAPDVVDHRCAVLSNIDSALDFGSYSGECVSSPDLCPCGLTFTFWLKPFDIYPNVTTDWFYLSTGGQNSSAHGISFLCSASDQTWKVQLRTSKLYYEVAITGSDVPEESWSHIALVYTQATGIKVYTNGTLSASSSDFETELKNDSKTHLVLGGTNSLSNFSKAAFSDFRIYQNALTDSQISNLAECNSIDGSQEITTVRQLDFPLDRALTFQCRTRGYPSPTIEWEYHDGQRVTKLNQTSSAVEVTRVNISDCIAESTLRVNMSYVNMSNKLKNINCRVGFSGGELVQGLRVEQLSFDGTVNMSTRGDVTVNATVHILCSLSGDEIYTVDWYRRQSLVNNQTATDELIVPSEAGSRYTTSQLLTSSASGDFSLDIRGFQDGDYGVYICSVNRGSGLGLIHLLAAKQPTAEPLPTQTKPMTSDAVDYVGVGSEKMVVSEAMISHSTLHEATPDRTTDGDSMVGTTVWTLKPMTSVVGTERSLVPESLYSQSTLPETTPGKTTIGTTAWLFKRMTSVAVDHVDGSGSENMVVSEAAGPLSTLHEATPDRTTDGDSVVGTTARTLKPMTSDAVDNVNVGSENMVVSEAVDSHSTLHEATPDRTTGDSVVGTTAWTLKPMTSDASEEVHVESEKMAVSEAVDPQSTLHETTPDKTTVQEGDSVVGTTAWTLKPMTSDASEEVQSTLHETTPDKTTVQEGDYVVGTTAWTLKPMTSDASDDVDVESEKMVLSESMNSQSTLRETTTPAKRNSARKKIYLTYGDKDKSKFVVRKSRLSWMVPVALCLAGVGFPGIIICYFICKREGDIDPLERLLMSKKPRVPIVKRPVNPAVIPKTLLAQPSPAYTAVRMIKIRPSAEQKN